MTLKGTPVCGGMAVAKALFIDGPMEIDINEKGKDPPSELKTVLDDNIALLEGDMSTLIKMLRENGKPAEAEMLEMHLTMLQDELFKKGIREFIDMGYSLRAAVMRGAQILKRILTDTGDPLMIERVSDVNDIANRLICHVYKKWYPSLATLSEPVIVIAEDLQPSALIGADYSNLKGMVLAGGSKTSHVSILAANMELPTVVGCGSIEPLLTSLNKALGNEQLFINAQSGMVNFDLTDGELKAAQEKTQQFLKERKELEVYKNRECVTSDGRRIYLNGNIMETTAIDRLLDYGADGVGLFRTEFLYMNRQTLPTEDEQYAVYFTAAKKLRGKPLTIRTIDIGADKHVEGISLDREENPSLGFRARYGFALPCRNYSRLSFAQYYGQACLKMYALCFPMIATIGELDKVLEILDEVKSELSSKGVKFDENIPVGIMIEIPSTAILAREFIKKVDFFSIGSNDLTQYTLAVDRMNEKIQTLYDPMNSAVLRLIANSIDACAGEDSKYCGLCGEMAADPQALPILIGLGLKNISVNSSAVLPIKRLVSTLNYVELKEKVKSNSI